MKTAMKYAITDIGSNTIRMNIYQQQGGAVRRIVSEKETAGLGSLRDSAGNLTQEGMDALAAAVGNFRDTASAVGADEFHAFATASLRNIQNSSQVLDYTHAATGVRPLILTGEQEAELDWKALHDEIGDRTGLMADLGGGSVELVQFENGELRNSETLSFGSLSLYRNFVSGILADKGELKDIADYVMERLEGLPWLSKIRGQGFLIGGSARAVGKLHMRMEDKRGEIDGYSMRAADIKRLRDSLLSDDKGFLQIIKVCPDRIHTILPGMTALHTILKTAGCEEFTLHNVGIREGFLKHYVMNPRKG